MCPVQDRVIITLMNVEMVEPYKNGISIKIPGTTWSNKALVFRSNGFASQFEAR